MGQDEFQNIVVGGKGRVKYAALPLHEPQKSRITVRFEGHLFLFFARGDDGGVGEHAAHGRSLCDDQADVFERRLFLGFRSPPQDQRNVSEGTGRVFAQFPFDAPALLFVRIDEDDGGIQRELYRAGGRHDAVPVRAGIEYGGVKPVGRAVGDVYVHNCPVSAERETSGAENMESCSYFSPLSSSMSMVFTVAAFSLP